MPRITTWIRPKDVGLFAQAFVGAPDVRLDNAAVWEREVREERIAASSAEASADRPGALDGADALLLTGGEDISSGHLRQPVPDPALIRDPFPERDAWEFAAVEEARRRGIPILAICRGHQLLNVACGGTLLLDIPGHSFPNQADVDIHALRFEKPVPAWRRYGRVNSTHHQAIDRVAAGFSIEARCAEDGVIEQISFPGSDFCVGVQYHPERSSGYRPLFDAFAAATRRR